MVAAKTKKKKECEVRLGSNPMFCTPGMLKWAINGYKFKRDRALLRKMFVEGFPNPQITVKQWSKVVHKLLLGEIQYTVDKKEGVVFKFEI